MNEEPKVSFNLEPPTWSEFQRKLKNTRMKSAPGPNGVPYKVYKKCPNVAVLPERIVEEEGCE